MNNLSFSSPSFSVLTVGKGDRPERAYSKIALHPGECVALETHDEVPCFYGKKGCFLAGEIFSADSALDGSSIEEVKKELNYIIGSQILQYILRNKLILKKQQQYLMQ